MSAQAGTTYGTRFVFTATGQALYSGTGSPEGVVTASVGDLYFRQDGIVGSPSELLYVKATGTRTATGWALFDLGGGDVAPAPSGLTQADVLNLGSWGAL